uniref:Uncharacterized protein n=1 Tax=Ascaris lumbricoides TaxID=6252 RepID=A0A0M3I3Z9_ASCLU
MFGGHFDICQSVDLETHWPHFDTHSTIVFDIHLLITTFITHLPADFDIHSPTDFDISFTGQLGYLFTVYSTFIRLRLDILSPVNSTQFATTSTSLAGQFNFVLAVVSTLIGTSIRFAPSGETTAIVWRYQSMIRNVQLRSESFLSSPTRPPPGTGLEREWPR